jgi:phosphinothricin acetyltransferase
MLLRPALTADIPAVTAIYGHWVAHGLASFEYDPPDVAEMARRHAAITEAGYPYLLIVACTAQGFRLMVAVIGDSANAPSIGLHAAPGFNRAGLLPGIGWKHGRWVDSVLMTRPLGQGQASAP